MRAVISAAEEGSTILLADGTYTFIENGNYNGIYITKPGITIRSSSGDPEKVILDASYSDLGGETAPITVAAQSITIADITIKRSIFHLIHLWNGSDNVKIHNVHLIDGGEQFIKSSPGDTNRINGGSVTCSKFIMTPIGRQNVWGYGTQYGGTRCYTGGIDTHSTNSWQISDNYFEGIYCESSGGHPIHGKKRTDVAYVTYVGGLAEHAIHMWNSDAGTRHIIERNTIVNCARGIGLGLGSTLRIHGGIVRNNMIFSSHPGGSEHDVGIMLEGGADVQIYNNTLFFSHSNAYANAIEYRFSTTTGATISNNLTNKAIARRDSASGILTTNVTTASSSWFANLASGNLHLASCSIPELSESGSVIDTNAVDVDNELRDGLAPDIGADQCVEI
ncbi:MAG: hypothetical protein A2451_01705 [Bdellovibrionales bacterium RIFOXYC2_FULL_39_8]|nr:MAG: hypothetical protein A2451_01705 [Bdellovibrionales bacterium RIFOXYC2_FULL_39_8]